jgi:dTDP-4-dehydrorhamnose reductase
MRTLLIGAAGQLGTALAPLLTGDVCAPCRNELDLANPPMVNQFLSDLQPGLVINAAAYNFVDHAEEEPERAFAINALGPRQLAIACRRLGAVLVQVSTDHVFGLDPSRTEPYQETDAPGPVSAYGVSKLAAEHFVRAICPSHFIVRTCGLYGTSRTAGKGNFVDAILRKGREQKEVAVVADQRCTPTSAADLAQALVRLVATGRYGLYHATNAGHASWAEFAQAIFRMAKIDARAKPITTLQYGAKAARPRFSVLDCAKLSGALSAPLPHWEESLANYLAARGKHAAQ